MPCRFKAKVISSSELPAKPTTSSERCSGEKPFFHSLLAGAHASDFSCEQWRPLSNLFHTLQTIKACIVVEYIGTSMCIYLSYWQKYLAFCFTKPSILLWAMLIFHLIHTTKSAFKKSLCNDDFILGILWNSSFTAWASLFLTFWIFVKLSDVIMGNCEPSPLKLAHFLSHLKTWILDKSFFIFYLLKSNSLIFLDWNDVMFFSKAQNINSVKPLIKCLLIFPARLHISLHWQIMGEVWNTFHYPLLAN